MNRTSKQIIFKKLVLICLSFIASIIFLESLLYIARQDTVILNTRRSALICLIPVLLLISYLIYYIFNLIDKINLKYYKLAIIIMSSIIVILQTIVLLFLTNSKGITDTYYVIDEAMTMLSKSNGIIDNTSVYFSKYGNNNFFTLLLYQLFRFLKSINIKYYIEALTIINVIFIDISIIFTINIANLIKGKNYAIKVLFLILVSPTTYFWLTFTYTNTSSMPFIMGALYFGLKIIKDNKSKLLNTIITGILTAIGFLIRPTTVIPLIAIILFIILTSQIKGFSKKIKVLALLLLTFFLLVGGISSFTNHHLKDTETDTTFPFTHWLMMGLKGQGYVNKEDINYTYSFETKDEKIQANVKEIKKRISNLGPIGYGLLVANKLEVVWGIGTDDYQAFNFNGEQIPPSYQYVYGDKNGLILIYCQVFRAFTFLFLLYSVINQIKQKDFNEIFLLSLTIFGSFIFFILWEANKKYSVCFVFLLLLLTADGLSVFKNHVNNMHNTLQSKKLNKLNIIYQTILACITIALLFFMIVDSKYYMRYKSEYRNPAIVIGYNNDEYFKLDNNNVLQQTFKTQSNFNEIQVLAKGDKSKTKDNSYKFELLDESGNILAQELFSANKINKDKYCVFNINEINSSNKETQYTIKISCLSSQEKYISYGYTITNTRDPYELGILSINNQETNTDLVFSVSYRNIESYTTSFRYIIICFVILTFFAMITLKTIRRTANTKKKEFID